MFPKMLVNKSVMSGSSTREGYCEAPGRLVFGLSARQRVHVRASSCSSLGKTTAEGAAGRNSAGLGGPLQAAAMSVAVRGQPQQSARQNGQWVPLSARSMQRPRHAPAMDEAHAVLQLRRSGSQNTSSRRGQSAKGSAQDLPEGRPGRTHQEFTETSAAFHKNPIESGVGAIGRPSGSLPTPARRLALLRWTPEDHPKSSFSIETQSAICKCVSTKSMLHLKKSRRSGRRLLPGTAENSRV